MIDYIVIAVLLLVAELVYSRIADKFNIIDKPNERSSHKRIVLRGGGIIFTIALWIWSVLYGFEYPWLLAGVTLAAGVSFWDDVKSLPDSVRLVAQFVAMALMFWNMGLFSVESLGFSVERIAHYFLFSCCCFRISSCFSCMACRRSMMLEVFFLSPAFALRSA